MSNDLIIINKAWKRSLQAKKCTDENNNSVIFITITNSSTDLASIPLDQALTNELITGLMGLRKRLWGSVNAASHVEPNGGLISGEVDEAFTCDKSVILRILNERNHKGLDWSVSHKTEFGGNFPGTKLVVHFLTEFEARAIVSAYMRTITLLAAPKAKEVRCYE